MYDPVYDTGNETNWESEQIKRLSLDCFNKCRECYTTHFSKPNSKWLVNLYSVKRGLHSNFLITEDKKSNPNIHAYILLNLNRYCHDCIKI